MTVSYKKSGKDGSSYYTNQASEIDDYYTYGDKEPPGVWYVAKNSFGERKTALGLQDGKRFGSEDTKKFAALTAGFHPETGEALVRNVDKSNRIALHDFTLSPPKSVSVVWSQANKGMKENIEKIHASVARNYLDYIGERALTSEGKGRGTPVKAMLRGAMFEHGSSRESDPQLHTHCVLMGVVERENGKTGALEAADMLRWQGAAASLYHADLAFNLRKAGFGIEKNKNLFEISGVPQEVRDAFSERRKQILELAEKKMRERGLDPSAATRAILQVAALESRSKKDELSRAELEVIWKERAELLGFTEKEVSELIGQDEGEYWTDEQCREEIKNVVAQITQNKAVFGEPELVAKSASAMIGKASREQILKAVESYKSELFVSYAEKEKDTVYTTKEMLLLESEMLEMCEKRDGRHILKEHDLPSSLSEEQRRAALGSITDDNYVTVVEGAAGAGKTYTMAAVARAYEQNGYQTIGLATSWSAALNLKKEAQLDNGRAITGWVNEVKKGKTEIDEKTLLIVDEAGMVSARHMHSIFEVSRKSGSKVVLLGDRKQMFSPEAGSGLSPVAEKLGTYRLDEIRRQHNVEDRKAVKLIFDGEAEKGLKLFAKNEGFINICDSDEELNAELTRQWEQSRNAKVGDTVTFHRDIKNGDGESVNEKITGKIINKDDRHWTVFANNELYKVEKTHLMIAGDNKSAGVLNRLGQQRLKDAGLLQGEARSFQTAEGESLFYVGDEIQFRVNLHEEQIYNRTRAQITGFSGDVMNLRFDDGREMGINMYRKELRDENDEIGFQLSYALTVDASQGLGAGFTFNKDNWRLGSNAAGVITSRHKEACKLFINRSEHYERVMRNTPATEWKPLSEFTDEDVMKSLAKSWSKKEVKASTLNHLWKNHDGALVDRKLLVAKEKALAKAAASSQADRKLKPLEELSKASDDQIISMIERLEEKGIHREAIRRAARQGILKADPQTGEPVLCGRSAAGDVMQILPFEGQARSSKSDLRGRFPPIILGDTEETMVVSGGAEALQKLTEYMEAQQPVPNIIITGGKTFALKGAQAKDLLAVSKTTASKEQTQAKRKGIEPSSHQERGAAKDGSSTKAREIAAARAAAEAGSRSSAAAVKAQAELAKQAEQHKTMGG